VTSVSLTPDGNYIYVAAVEDFAVNWFKFNPKDTSVTFLGYKSNNFTDCLYGASGTTVSADGKQVYVIASYDNALSWYDRNESTGSIIFRKCFEDTKDGIWGMSSPQDVIVSPDGNNIYVIGRTGSYVNAINCFKRDKNTGEPEYIGSVYNDNLGGLKGATALNIPPNGNFVFVTASQDSSLSWFARNTTTGALTYVSKFKDGQDSVYGLYGATSIVFDKSGKYVYLTSCEYNSISWFKVDYATSVVGVSKYKHSVKVTKYYFNNKFLSIFLQNPVNKFKCRVFDIRGRVIKEYSFLGQLTNSFSFPIAGAKLASGVYNCEVIADNNKCYFLLTSIR